MTNTSLAKTLLSRLTPAAFAAFLQKLFSTRDKPLDPRVNLGPNVFVQPILDSYGGSLHRAFVAHYVPQELFGAHPASLVADYALIATLRRVREAYSGQLGQWGMVSPYTVPARKLQVLAFLTNIHGLSREEYERTIIPAYSRLARKARIAQPRLFVGSYDSFIDLSVNATMNALSSFLRQDTDGMRIAVQGDKFVVAPFATESILTAGVLGARLLPYQPLYEGARESRNDIIEEFEELLNASIAEAKLEDFIARHFRDIFGSKYDRIERQLWLRMPEVDVTGRDRRVDLFLRNAVTSDWELVELKRTDVALTTSYRQDMPMFTREVLGAIQQLRNYSRLLLQQSIRDKLARNGIEYFEPEVSLVIGRAPSIQTARWRRLVAQSGDVRVTTYDQLLGEMKMRAAERYTVLDPISQLPGAPPEV